MVECLPLALFLPGTRVHMLASTVSSKFLQSMAAIEGFCFEVFSSLEMYYNYITCSTTLQRASEIVLEFRGCCVCV